MIRTGSPSALPLASRVTAGDDPPALGGSAAALDLLHFRAARRRLTRVPGGQEDGDAREAAPLMRDRYPELAAKHVARGRGGKTDYLKA